MEQHEITVGKQEFYAHLLNFEDWSIQTEQERFSQKYAEGLPELCFSTLPSTGALICIKRGESGYYPSDWNTPDCAQNRQIVDEQNQRLGVTPAQEEAMLLSLIHILNVPDHILVQNENMAASLALLCKHLNEQMKSEE